MQAFLNNPAVKKTYLDRVKAHQKADEIIKGKYWENGKGCAVGCTIHSSNHNAYETELGIPEWLARTEDTLFEGMSDANAKTWPANFIKAIKVGVDLDKIQKPFQIIVLTKCLKSLDALKIEGKEFEEIIDAIAGSRKAVQTVLELWKTGDILNNHAAWIAAWSAAWIAARIAARSAESAARSAESAAWSAGSAASAARSAASIAGSVARSAESAAWGAASAARSAAWSAGSAAWRAAFDDLADELLCLIKGLE